MHLHQLTLLDMEPKRYEYSKQMEALIKACADGEWRSLAEFERALGYRYSQTGLSARIRDLRRCIPQFAEWTSEHVKDTQSHHFYRIVRRAPQGRKEER